MKDYTNQISIRSVFTALCICLSLAACKKAENYYQKLDAQPEISLNYNAVYGVGDTLTIMGRLRPENDLTITIGGIKVELFDLTTTKVDDSPSGHSRVIDWVSIRINGQMGIGVDRPITITSGGNTIQCPSIEIVEGQNSGVLSGSLKAVQHATLSFTATPLYCNSGTGSIYIWNSDRTVSHIRKDGMRVTVLAQENLRDERGAFQVTTFQSGAIDPRERYLYFSALTTDGSGDNATNAIYRLCRYDLQTKQLTTLNRTLYPNVAEQRTAASAQPFEGQIANVKVYQITHLYPDSEGNVYAVISNRAIARLTAEGNFKYQFKGLWETTGSFVPQTYNPATGGYYSNTSPQAIVNLLPGVRAPEEAAFATIDPKENLFYAGSYSSRGRLLQFDLVNRVQIHTFSSTTSSRPYISGSFDILSTNNVTWATTSSQPSMFGVYPLPGEQLLILYYQNMPTTNVYSRQYPAWGVLDYKAKRGYRYAPYRFERGTYQMNNADRILNTDEEGMVYMTANSNTVIVKTQYQ